MFVRYLLLTCLGVIMTVVPIKIIDIIRMAAELVTILAAACGNIIGTKYLCCVPDVNKVNEKF